MHRLRRRRRKRAHRLDGGVRAVGIRRRKEAKGPKRQGRGPPALGGWLPSAAALLFEADVPQVSIIDTDDAVILLEEALLLGLAAPLQTLDQQAKSPAMFRPSSQQDAREARQYGC